MKLLLRHFTYFDKTTPKTQRALCHEKIICILDPEVGHGRDRRSKTTVGDELMQIRHLPAPEDCPAWLVTLDCDSERRLTVSDLMRLLENCRGIGWDDQAQRYALDGRDFGPQVCCPAVILRNGDEIRISLILS